MQRREERGKHVPETLSGLVNPVHGRGPPSRQPSREHVGGDGQERGREENPVLGMLRAQCPHDVTHVNRITGGKGSSIIQRPQVGPQTEQQGAPCGDQSGVGGLGTLGEVHRVGDVPGTQERVEGEGRGVGVQRVEVGLVARMCQDRGPDGSGFGFLSSFGCGGWCKGGEVRGCSVSVEKDGADVEGRGGERVEGRLGHDPDRDRGAEGTLLRRGRRKRGGPIADRDVDGSRPVAGGHVSQDGGQVVGEPGKVDGAQADEDQWRRSQAGCPRPGSHLELVEDCSIHAHGQNVGGSENGIVGREQNKNRRTRCQRLSGKVAQFPVVLFPCLVRPRMDP